MPSITRLSCMLLVILCLCMLTLLAACGEPGSTIVTPNMDKGQEIVQPTPTANPFPVHHSALPLQATP